MTNEKMTFLVVAAVAAGNTWASFDLKTCPMLFVHGDADKWAAMNSVKCWEQLRRMGIQCDLHTLATRSHCFQRKAAPGTGRYTWLDRIWEFMNHNGLGAQGAP